jgi:hypothetical protein
MDLSPAAISRLEHTRERVVVANCVGLVVGGNEIDEQQLGTRGIHL